METLTVCVVEPPAVKVSVPEAAVKSLPVVAVPFEVAKSTVKAPLRSLRVTVKLSVLLPLLPSLRLASLMTIVVSFCAAETVVPGEPISSVSVSATKAPFVPTTLSVARLTLSAPTELSKVANGVATG
jgi:hypothetical protein